MTEKKIDLSNVQVGDLLWTVFDGDCICDDVDKKSVWRVCIKGCWYAIDGKYTDSDKYPTCFHSREEFLDFHGIAPVRMTVKELREYGRKECEGITPYENLEKGFLLAGGQIIEEPKNLPCKWCGCEVEKTENPSGYIKHPENENCPLSGWRINANLWNDESKRGKLG